MVKSKIALWKNHQKTNKGPEGRNGSKKVRADKKEVETSTSPSFRCHQRKFAQWHLPPVKRCQQKAQLSRESSFCKSVKENLGKEYQLTSQGKQVSSFSHHQTGTCTILNKKRVFLTHEN
jgi:hypothetical protein